jgi:uracil-DNA glycosylase family 4
MPKSKVIAPPNVDDPAGALARFGPGPSLAAMIDADAGKYGISTEEARGRRLEFMLRRPCLVELLPTGKYAGARAEWLPGHRVDFNSAAGTGAGFYGPARAKAMVILPGPLQRDVNSGRYLSGEAGRMLANAFARNGVSVNGFYVTGAVKFYDPHPNMADIPAAWAYECKWQLFEEIRRVRPEYLLVCGAKALKLLLGNKAKLYTYRSALTDWHGLKLTATADIHALVKNPETMPGFESDVRMLAGAVRGAALPEDRRQYHYLKTADQLRWALDRCRDARAVAVDCEWSGESPRTGGRLLTIQFSVRAGEAYVAVLWSKTGGYEFDPSPAVAVEMLRELFCRPGVRIIGQNFRSDLEWLIDAGLDVTDAFAARGHDTMLSSHLLSEGDDHDLMALTLRHTDMGRYDYAAQLLLDRGLKHADLPDDVLHPYAASDVDALMRIYPKLEQLLWDNHLDYCGRRGLDPLENCYGPAEAELYGRPYRPTLWNLFRHVAMPVSAPIKEIELEGMPVDRDRLESMTKTFCGKRDELLADLRRMANDPEFNPNSAAQVREILFGDPDAPQWDEGPAPGAANRPKLRLGLTPIMSTGKHGKLWSRAVDDGDAEWVSGKGWTSPNLSPSTKADSLAIFADDGCDFARVLKDYKTVSTMTKNLLTEPIEDEDGVLTQEKGVAAYIDPDGRVRTHISQLAETGRYRSYSVNLQNLPKSKEATFSRIFTGSDLPSVRSIMAPPPGGIYIEADYQSAELYTLAYIADDKAFKEALAAVDGKGKPISFHTSAMVKFFKLPYSAEEATRRMKADTQEAKDLKKMRVGVKSVNFGVVYGRGAAAVSQAVKQEGVNCTPDEAQGWIDGYAESFPQAWDYLQWCRDQVKVGKLVNPYGRERHFPSFDYDDRDNRGMLAALERESMNFPIQGTVADSLSLALCRLYAERNRRGMETRIVLPIHDAVLLWAPYREVADACDLLRWAMTEAPGAEVPGIGLRYGIDLEYMTRWNEPADPKYLYEISNGRLGKAPEAA